MQSNLSDLLAHERIAEFRREADHDRLAALARAVARRSRGGRRSRWTLVTRQPRRAI